MTRIPAIAILIMVIVCSLPHAGAGEAVLHDLLLRNPDTVISNTEEAHVGWINDDFSKTGIILRPESDTMAPALIAISSLNLPELKNGIDSLTLHFTSQLRAREDVGDRSATAIFAVRVNDTEIHRQRQQESEPLEHSVDLAAYAGTKVSLLFILDPEIAREAMIGFIIQPQIRITGPADVLATTLQNEGLHIPHQWMADPESPIGPAADKRLRREITQRGAAVAIASMDPELDLDFAVRHEINNGYFSYVPNAPAIVAGQGAHSDNHTLIRVLGPHGTRESQFLAYPPDIRGGVLVESGRDARKNTFIATTPATCTETREIRIFTRSGAHIASIQPGDPITPPFRIATGNFRSDHPGDEIAIAGQSETGAIIEIHRIGDAKPLASFPLNHWSLPELSTGPGNRLLAHAPSPNADSPNAYATLEPNADTPRFWPLPEKTRYLQLIRSPFVANELLATTNNTSPPSLTTIDSFHNQRSIPLANRDSSLWIGIPEAWHPSFPPDKTANPDSPIQFAQHGRIRVDGLAANLAASPPTANTPQTTLQQYLASHGLFKALDQQRPRLWNPSSSTAQAPEFFAPFANRIDPNTGLPTFLMLHRSGNPATLTINHSPFQASSMALEIDALDAYYHQPLRAFLRHFSAAYHAAPDSLPNLNPSQPILFSGHGEASLGDYHPAMIQAFIDRIRLHYGDDHHALRKRFNLPDDGPLDAPRNLGRGPWDAYSTDNPWFKEWLEFNVHSINRMHAVGCREALLAGIPPELVRGQFIPTPADPATGPAHPLLANAPATYSMIAGTGFGFGNPDPTPEGARTTLEFARAAHSSGFNAIAIHQTLPWTTDADETRHWLQELRENGVHSIQFNNPHETSGIALETTHATFQKVIQSMAETPTPPMPPATQIGRIRPWNHHGTPIAIIASGPEDPGLLQSILADGSPHGSVHTVPFHTQTTIDDISFEQAGKTKLSQPLTLSPGAQIDIPFHLTDTLAPGTLQFNILRDGHKLPGLSGELPASNAAKTNMRLQFRSHSDIDGITIELIPPENSTLTIEHATRQTPVTASPNPNGNKGQPHRGGIFFSIIE